LLKLLRSFFLTDTYKYSNPLKMGKRLLFAYCFFSFLPLLSYLVILPGVSLPYYLLALAIHINNGVLLLAMSSLVREQMPFKRPICKLWVYWMGVWRKKSPVVHVSNVSYTVSYAFPCEYRSNSYLQWEGRKESMKGIPHPLL